MHVQVQVSIDGLEVAGEFEVQQQSPAWRRQLIAAITAQSRRAAEHLQAELPEPPALEAPDFVPLEALAPAVG